MLHYLTKPYTTKQLFLEALLLHYLTKPYTTKQLMEALLFIALSWGMNAWS